MAGIAGLSAIGTLLSRFTGLGRTVAQAAALGVNPVSDAYTIANTTPNIIYDLVLGGVLAGTLVPVFVQAVRDDEDGGWEAISAVCSAIAAVIAAVTLLSLVGVPWIIRLLTATRHGADQRALAITLLYMFVPQLAFYAMTSVVTAILAARKSFAAPMFTPILNNVVVIGVLVAAGLAIGSHPTAAGVRHDHGAVLLLGLGTTAGVAAMALALLPSLRKAGVHLHWVWNPRHPANRRILRLAGWVAGAVVANQIAFLFVLLIAHHPGDITAYSFAYQFFLLPHGIWIVSLLGPMETGISERWQARDRDGARHHLIETTWLGMVLIVPAALGYAVLAHPAINLVLLHGNVTAAGARATGDALIAFALGLPTFGLFFILMRTYQALQDTRSMFRVYVFENTVNVVLALVLYPHFGIRGLAAAWSLAYALAAAAAAWHVSHRMRGLSGRHLGLALTMVGVASVFAAGAAWGVSTGLGHVPGAQHQLGIAVRVILSVAAGVVVYMLAARTLGFDEMRNMLQLRRRPG